MPPPGRRTLVDAIYGKPPKRPPAVDAGTCDANEPEATIIIGRIEEIDRQLAEMSLEPDAEAALVQERDGLSVRLDDLAGVTDAVAAEEERRAHARARATAAPKPKTTARTYADAWRILEASYSYFTKKPPKIDRSIETLGEVAHWLQDVGSGASIGEAFHGRAGAMDQARAVVGHAISMVNLTWDALHLHGAATTRNQWRLTVDAVKAAKPWLVTLSGEVGFDDNELLVDFEGVTRDAYAIHAAIASLPAVLALGTYAVPIVAQELSLAAGAVGGPAVLNFALANPIAATELGLLVAGTGITIATSGGLKEYLSQWETGEGKRQILQDLVVVLHFIITGLPSTNGGSTERRDNGNTPGRRYRAHLDVDQLDGDQIRGRVISVEPEGATEAWATAPRTPGARTRRSEREQGAEEWARRVADSAPEELRDPARLEIERREYAARRDEIDKVYAEIMSGERDAPVGLNRERLRLAVEGDPHTGERIPLTFPDEKTYREFQTEIRAVFESEGITDAVVQQLGSGTKGFKSNPKKKFGTWSPKSDADFAIFSRQALAQAMDVDAQPNRSVSMGGRYTVVKNEAKGGKGLIDTSIGERLEVLSRRWTQRLWPNAQEKMIDFKLNLDVKPFDGAITIIDMGRDQ
jgi:hypothetical protein